MKAFHIRFMVLVITGLDILISKIVSGGYDPSQLKKWYQNVDQLRTELLKEL